MVEYQTFNLNVSGSIPDVPTMKVIAKCNFGKDTTNEKAITIEGLNQTDCLIIANALNLYYPENHYYWYEVVDDDYKLYVFEP